MTCVEKKMKLSDEKFKRRIGTTKPVFLTMLDILATTHIRLHQSGGKPKPWLSAINFLSPSNTTANTSPWSPSPMTMIVPKVPFAITDEESNMRRTKKQERGLSAILRLHLGQKSRLRFLQKCIPRSSDFLVCR